MEYLTNDRNAILDATLAATNIVPSNVIYRTDDDAKQGGGQAVLSGDFTGASDLTVMVKIADDTIEGAPKISAPAFSGIGNGTLDDITADSSVAAQTFTVTLEDLGTQTLKAYAPFQGVTLQAKTAGVGGNDLAIRVDNSALTYTPTLFALKNDLQAGTNEYTGDDWNFGAVALNADQTIPDGAPRITFGADPQVYRQYKFYRNGQYVYGFSPSPVRDVPTGAVINAVTGSRTVEVLNSGSVAETYTDIVSLYDALTQLRGSSLISVIGAVVNDKTSGGQAMVDLSVWTSAFVTGVVADGSDAIVHSDLIVTPDPDAPTETLTIKCIDGTEVGGEKWSVFGTVSGRLDDAITNVLYDDGGYAFTIPLPIISTDPAFAAGTINVEYLPSDNTRDTMPQMCVVQPVIGSAGRAGTWDFVWTKRPTSDCDCDSAPMSGGPTAFCLGVAPGGPIVGLDDAHRYRQILLDRWMRSITASMFDEKETTVDADTYVSPDASLSGLGIATSSRNAIRSALDAIFTALAATPPTAWSASAAQQVGNIVVPTTLNGLMYRCKVAGTTGSSEPTWGTTLGSVTASDGTVTWEAFSQDAIAGYDSAFAQAKAVIAPWTVAPLNEWKASTAIDGESLGVLYYVPATPNGHYYSVIDGGTTDSSPPSWPTTGGTVTDGTVKWQDRGTYWTASTPVATGQIQPGAFNGIFEATTGGTTGSSEPSWDADVVTDGSVVWKRIANFRDQANVEADLTGPTANFTNAVKALFSEALTAAGAASNFDSASTNGDGCWHDAGGTHWWVYQGDEPYLPIQNGVYYVSSETFYNPDGTSEIRTTKEFGLGIKFGCETALVEGDTVRIVIGGANVNGHGYQEGDNYSVSVNHATDLPFGGGQTGDDTLTWSVIGSVSGKLADCALVTTALASYTSTHLDFAITPGGIPFALGDQFTFAIEGGHYQVSYDEGGTWSSAAAIADTVDLEDGLVLSFIGGAAPSWVADDQWTFKAEATNGVDQIRQPTDARMKWTGSTQVDITPGDNDVDAIFIADHTIPSGATITLKGSDDNFSTTPLNMVIPYAAGNIYAKVTDDKRAKYRLTVNTSGSIQWLFLGDPLQLAIKTGVTELGQLTKQWRMPSILVRRALGAQVQHSFITQDSAQALLDGLAHACQYDDQRLGIVPNELEPESSIVLFSANSLDMTDAFDFQPRTGNRYISVSLQLDPAP